MNTRHLILAASFASLLSPLPGKSQPPSQGLVAYYPFTENANDESGNGNHGIVHGATLTTDRFGNPGSAYDFDGLDDYIAIGSDSSLLITSDLSVSMWVRIRTMPEAGAFDPLIARGEWGESEDLNNVWNLHIMNIGGQTYLRHSHEHGQGINTDLVSIRPLEGQTWVHVGVVRDAGTQTYRFYVNGIPEPDQHYQNNPTGGTNTSGYIGWAPWGIINYFDGSLDDIHIYNRALTDAEMQVLFAGPSDGLVAYYPFNGTADDESGNGNNGIVHGATLIADRFGNANAAYNFDGDDFINVGSNSSLLITSDLSVSMWARIRTMPEPGTFDPLIARGEWGETEDLNNVWNLHIMNISGQTYLRHSHEHGQGINTDLMSIRPLEGQTWIHVGVVRDTSARTYRFYVNGIPEPDQHYQNDPTGGTNTSGYIGWAPWGIINYFDGSLDDVRIYNRALTDAEMLALFTGPSDGLLAYYPFNGTANDESGNGNHGILLGGATVTDVLILGDNASDALSLPYIILDGLTNFTFAGLLKINTLHTIGGFLVAANVWVSGAASFHPGGNGFNITYDATIRKWRMLIVPPEQAYIFESNTTIEDNDWHHVSVTRDNTTAKLYIDGVQAGNPIVVPAAALVADPNGFIVGQEQDFVGGGFDANQSWAGEMDNVRIYNRALTDDEILDLYFHDRQSTEEFALSVDTVYSFPGDTILVPVNVQFSTDSTYSSAEITFSGHQGLLDFIGIKTDSSLIGTAGWIVQVNETDSLLITAAAGAQDISGNGVLFWLEFAVPDTASGFIPIGIESALFNESSIPITTSPGGVHVIGYFAGDVSLDGEVHAFDASLILKYLVGTITLNPQQLNNANVSSDTTVSALDASLILQYVVGLLDSLPYDTSSGLLLASGDIAMDDDEIQPGQTLEIPLNLSNGSNILSFCGLVTFNPEHLVYNDVVWSQQASDFTVETNAETGEITFAGSSTMPMEHEGVFGTLRFTVSNALNGNETIVQLQKLRWNENPEMEKVASATLSIVLTSDDRFGLPTEFALKQNFPNPFNPGTNIRYELPKKEYVRLTVYDVIGKEVAVLVDQDQPAGKYDVKFNGVDLGSGVYFYHIQAGGFVDTKKLLLLK